MAVVPVVCDINLAFSSLNWCEAVDRADMDCLWSKWVFAFDDLIEKHVGTRRARMTSWGRKFDLNVRALCIQASKSRSWYILACEAQQDCESYFKAWVKDRKAFLAAWERSKCDWFSKEVCEAVRKGDVAIWRLLNGKAKKKFRPLVMGKGRILTDPALITKELLKFHERSRRENTSIPTGKFIPVTWDKDFSMEKGPKGDIVLVISNDLVVANVKKLKISTVPDNIHPVLIKVLFGSADSLIL